MFNICFKQVEESYVNSILLLFKSVFKKKITKSYYINKYKNDKVYNSFILVNKKNNQPVAHVGYSFIDFKYNTTIYKIAIRFSSMVKKTYQKKGLYEKLLLGSFEILKKKQIHCVICWPNQINIIGSSKHNNFIFLGKVFTYSKFFIGKNKFNIKKIKQFKNCTNKNFRIINNIKKSIDCSILKNNDYILRRYFKLNLQKKYYFFYYKKNIIFFSIRNKYEINITDFLYLNSNFKSTFTYFLSLFKDYKIKLNLWINPNNTKIHSFLLDNKFIKTEKSFNLGYYRLTNYKFLQKKIFKNYNYSMGDSDIF